VQEIAGTLIEVTVASAASQIFTEPISGLKNQPKSGEASVHPLPEDFCS